MKKITALFVLIIITGLIIKLDSQQVYKTRLNDGWKFLKGDLGGIWEAVRPVKAGDPESVPFWESVTLPHCFNAADAVDPDVN
jgi:beta-galactosidase